jgi:hypothetical protein
LHLLGVTGRRYEDIILDGRVKERTTADEDIEGMLEHDRRNISFIVYDVFG